MATGGRQVFWEEQRQGQRQGRQGQQEQGGQQGEGLQRRPPRQQLVALKDKPRERSRRFELDVLPIFANQVFGSLTSWREELAVASDSLTDPYSALGCLFDFMLSAPSKILYLESLLDERSGHVENKKNCAQGSHGHQVVDASTIPTCNTFLNPSITNFANEPGLLPISPSALGKFLAQRTQEIVSSHRASLGYVELCAKLCRLVVRSLNFLACAGWSETPVCLGAPTQATEAQPKTLDHCFEASFYFLDSNPDYFLYQR